MKKKLLSFTFNNEKFYGILEFPDKGNTTPVSPMIIFLNGWSGYRIGPHQMFVKFATELTQKGFCCFRFDFRGRGWSEGDYNYFNDRTMLEDLHTVLKTLKMKYQPKCFILLGICAGARVGMYAPSIFEDIDYIVALSGTPLWPEVIVQKEISQIKHLLKEYYKKIFYFETWEKIFSDSIHINIIFKTIFIPVKRSFFVIKKKSKFFLKREKLIKSNNEVAHSEKEKQKHLIGPLVNFKGEVLFIHGENDPDAKIAIKHEKILCSQMKVKYFLEIIEGANHSFYSLTWKNQVLKIITNWLDEKK